jgi:predicted nucleic acid-binding protein
MRDILVLFVHLVVAFALLTRPGGIRSVVAAATNALGAGFQGDPFDRAIAATAIALNLTLITADPAVRDARACADEYYPFRHIALLSGGGEV